jgi:hypothetical protein
MGIFTKKYKKGDLVKVAIKGGSKSLIGHYNNQTASVHRVMKDGFYEIRMSDSSIIVVLSNEIKSI